MSATSTLRLPSTRGRNPRPVDPAVPPPCPICRGNGFVALDGNPPTEPPADCACERWQPCECAVKAAAAEMIAVQHIKSVVLRRQTAGSAVGVRRALEAGSVVLCTCGQGLWWKTWFAVLVELNEWSDVPTAGVPDFGNP